jgi:hypothetical protein
MSTNDVLSWLNRRKPFGGNKQVEFIEQGIPYVFCVKGIKASGFEVKGYTRDGIEVLTLAGGTGEETIIDVRKNDHNLSSDIRFAIFHMAKCKWFYERDKSHESHNNYLHYRNGLLYHYKNEK